jgi:hypothetical protein
MDGDAMYRTGVMAPPTLYDSPQQPGLLAHDPSAEPHQLSWRTLFWCGAIVLGLVEVFVGSFGT